MESNEKAAIMIMTEKNGNNMDIELTSEIKPEQQTSKDQDHTITKYIFFCFTIIFFKKR